MNKDEKIYCGAYRLMGSAILRSLKAQGYSRFVLYTIDEIDLTQTMCSG